MTLSDLIRSQYWLSVKMTLASEYPAQNEILDKYEIIFESLKLLEAVENDMLIVLTEVKTDEEDDTESSYIDISGRKLISDKSLIANSFALEFEKWETWLGMELAPETIDNFSDLEIISHCLFEMTYCGYEQDKIQSQFDSINKTIDEFKNLSKDEIQNHSKTLDELLRSLRDQGGS